MEVLLILPLLILGFIYSVALGLSKDFREKASEKRKRKVLRSKAQKTKDSYILQNNNVSINYDFIDKTFSFKDKEGRFSAKVKLKNHYLSNTDDTLFDTTFDTACMLFNSKTDFETIKNFFELRFDVEIIKRKIGKQISSKNPSTKEKVDINNASIEEIAKLPGINIVLAKKIVAHRELIQGFKSVVEFHNAMNIKQIYKARLTKQIVINKIENKDEPLNQEREIDF